VNRGGKGSHRNFVYQKVSRPITISGAASDDAKNYQVRAVKRDRGVEVMKEGGRYAKIVEWSNEDQRYVGSSPGLKNVA